MLQKTKITRGGVLVAIIATTPLLLWATGPPLLPIISLSALMLLAGKAAALAGMTLFMLNPLLGVRISAIITVFGGIDKTFKLHRSTGKLAFFLLLAHPLLLGIGLLIGGAKLSTLWDWSSLLIILGAIGLVALTVLTGLSIYAHITHQHWVKIHKLFGWLIPVFAIHAYISKSAVVTIKPLLVYMSILTIVGFGAFLYHSILGTWLIKRYKYKVVEVNHLEGDVTEIALKPVGLPIMYHPGQFAFVSFLAPGIDPEAHPYSFTTANNGSLVRFAVKGLGDDTKALKSLSTGASALLEGPYGNFGLAMSVRNDQVWIAGGVGITPFLSMARSLDSSSHHSISLFYAAQKLVDAAFLHELIEITRHLQNFRVHIVDFEVSGFVTTEMIEKTCDGLQKFDFLICGPPPMMKGLRESLADSGVASHRIHTEDFSV